MLNTDTVIAMPGKSASHQPREKKVRASLRISPHVGVVGFTPKPRNDSVASAKIADETPTVACTMMGASELGRM